MPKIPNPRSKQKDVIYGKVDKEKLLVFGTAGSGKSTVAIIKAYDAFELNPTKLESHILLLTYNKALKVFMQTYFESSKRVDEKQDKYYSDVDGHRRTLEITNYDRFIYRHVPNEKKFKPSSSNDMGYIHELNDRIFNRSEAELHLSEVIAKVTSLDPISKKLEIQKIIYEYRYLMQTGYQFGSGKFEHQDRIQMLYSEIKNRNGVLTDFYDLERIFLEIKAKGERKYDLIIIDEAQDFPSNVINAFLLYLSDEGTIILLADEAQRIYHDYDTIKQSKFEFDRTVLLDENYRNTQNIVKFMERITEHRLYKKQVHQVKAIEIKEEGQPVQYVHFEQGANNSEQEWLTQRISSLAKEENVCVLFRNVKQLNDFVNYYRASPKTSSFTIINGDIEGWSGRGVHFSTYHSAKGLEFNRVFLPFLGSSTVFNTSESIPELVSQELNLLYVGASRAKNSLTISYTGSPCALLPDFDDRFMNLVEVKK